ncbi:MAG: hypothetical protein V2A72_04275 [Candidatus Omnitrophota bacterium]
MRKITLCIILLTILACMIFVHEAPVFAQYYQQADYGQMSNTKKNELGGYDYFDANGNKTGYSKKTYSGDYEYYDNEGNKLGALKQDKAKNTYTFYNADNIATGNLQKTPTGEYRYRNKSQDGLTSVTPPATEDIGFVSPSVFMEGTYNSNLDGGFKRQQEQQETQQEQQQ